MKSRFLRLCLWNNIPVSKCSILDWEKTERENTAATLNAVMQMFSHLRAVEDLEPLPLPEAEVILSPGFVVVKSHKQSHPCRKTKSDTWWLELAEVNCMAEVAGIFIVGFAHLSHAWAACYVMAPADLFQIQFVTLMYFKIQDTI